MTESLNIDNLGPRINSISHAADKVSALIDELKKQLPTSLDERYSARNLGNHKIERQINDLAMFELGLLAARAELLGGQMPALEYGVPYDRTVLVFSDIPEAESPV